MTAPAAPPTSAATPAWLTNPADRAGVDAALDAVGRPLPLHARAPWGAAFPDVPTAVAALRTSDGRYTAGVGVTMHASRALPGHQLWRVDRVGTSLGVEAALALLRFVGQEARRRRRVLRVEVSVAARDAEFRSALGRALSGAQFRQVPVARTSAFTLVRDLEDEETMLASLSKQTRRNIRAVERQPVTVAPVDDPALADRMHALMRETLARTGGTYEPVDWAGAMQVSRALPERSRLVGVARTDVPGPERLLAFAWARHHGDHAVYDAGASTRQTDLKITMADPMMWDLVRWARQTGARWFDFGGVSRPEPGAADPLAGISDFKRSFSRQVEEVGDEYVLDAAPVRSAVARALGSGVRTLRALTAR